MGCKDLFEGLPCSQRLGEQVARRKGKVMPRRSIMKNVGSAIGLLLAEANTTIEILAERLHCKTAVLKAIQENRREISVSEMIKLAKALCSFSRPP
jgi:ribosome-binding protein aMBF1 (putative translation factor)